ncbi:MAG: hypothetical protein ACLFRK_02160 [Candidatus Nanohaloarchaea archaeon]
MSEDETCHFGHHFEHSGRGGPSGEAAEAVDKIKKGEITSYQQLQEEYDGVGIRDIMGGHVRKVKVSGNDQGDAYATILSAPDKYDQDLDYSVHRVEESIFVSPQSQLHDEFMQRKQQAEQRVNQTMQGFSDLLEEKHLLEHDIRKLRSRAEAFTSKDEDILKGDFVELVDGADAGNQQGGEAALKTLQERNIYPTIVSDFMEMDSVDDLKKADKHDDVEEDGHLAELPDNEKAILRKKYAMYEKWKDLYGSEVNRRLEELKSQLRHVESSIEETRDRIEPYIRDVVMINNMGENQHMIDNYYQWKGYAAMIRQLDFIAYKGLKKEGGQLQVTEDESEATHYRVMHFFGQHIVQANSGQPNQPGGSSTGVVFWRPAVVCEHVFDNIIRPKINKAESLAEEMVDRHVGSFNPNEKAREYREAREDKEMSVRDLRIKVQEEVGEPVPIELSSKIRRIEDGLDSPDSIEEKFGEEVFEALKEVLGIEDEEEEEKDLMYSPLQQELKKFTGQTDKYYAPSGGMGAMMAEFRYDFYFDWKISLGLYTMK